MEDEMPDTEEKSINDTDEKRLKDQENESLFTLFELEGEDYGVPVDLMVEIVRNVSTFNIPGSPDHVVGATDLRGEIVPIIDLKKILKIGRTEEDLQDVLLVRVRDQKFALPVDRLKDIVSSTEDKLIDPSSITNLNDKMLKWIIRLEDDRTVRVLDIKELIDDEIRKVDLKRK